MNIIKDLLKSKKFVVGVLATASAVALYLGVPEASIDEIITMISPLLVYIGAQGFADIGKEEIKEAKRSS